MGIFHPPCSTNNQTTNATFIDEITDLLTEKITSLDNLIIHGDLNINTNAENTIFRDTMIAFGFGQHVQGPVHRLGNTLDQSLHNWKVKSKLSTPPGMDTHQINA